MFEAAIELPHVGKLIQQRWALGGTGSGCKCAAWVQCCSKHGLQGACSPQGCVAVKMILQESMHVSSKAVWPASPWAVLCFWACIAAHTATGCVHDPAALRRFPQEWAARQQEQQAELPKSKPPRHNWFQGGTDVTAVLAQRGV